MKKGKTVLLVAGALALILVAGICSMGLLFQSTTDNAENLYSQIDNEKIAPITPHGGMNYRYTLQAYGEDGRSKSMELDTSRVLKDGAFIKIQTVPMRGVIGWEEMQYEELPPAVQGRYEP